MRGLCYHRVFKMQRKLLSIVLLFTGLSELNAQNTHFPIYNPSAKHSVSADTGSSEKLKFQWNTALDELKQQVNAGDTNFAIFLSVYRSSIDSAFWDLYTKTHKGRVNQAILTNDINSQKQKLFVLYNNFAQLKNKYHTPPLAPSYTPPSCNPSCSNMDFSSGNLDYWYGYYATNNASVKAYKIINENGGSLGAVTQGAFDPNVGTYQIHITSKANNDWFLWNYYNIAMPQASPWGNGYSAMIGDSVTYSYPSYGQVAVLSQEFQVTPTTNSITYAYSVLLENPNHSYYQQPFFSVTVFDQNGDTIKNCGEYSVYSGPGLPGFTGYLNPAGIDGPDTVYWRPWTQVNVPLTSYVGQCVIIQFEVSDCEPGGHFGYAYVDASCSEFAITANSPSGVICGKNGYLTLSGPAGEKAYVWSGPKGGIISNDTLQTVNVDSLGKYKLIITPVTGALCKDTLFYTVKGRDSIRINTPAVLSSIACNGATGSVLASAVNGAGPYTYAWTPSAQKTALAKGLSAGTYTVTITDTNACPVSAVVVLTQPAVLTASSNFTGASCGSNNGTATVTVGGGVPAYTYSWKPSGETTALATGLTAGAYTITVTDNNNCTVTSSVTITQPPFVTANITSITPVSCFGRDDGAATASANGGPSPYIYKWSPNGGTANTATGLSAGNYTVTVTDNNGCSSTAQAVVTQSSLLTATINTINGVSCYGGTGSATATVAGGTVPYTYHWTPAGGTGITGTGLSAGSYTVSVTDNKGCAATTSVNITQPALLVASLNSTHAYCNLATGTATASVSGGTSPYTYAWSIPKQNKVTATGLAAGNYTVTVTDNKHCTATASVSVTQPVHVTASPTIINNVTCFDGNDGAASVTATDGLPPYTYLWTPGGQTTPLATGLFALTYTVKVTDADGCAANISVTVPQPPQVKVSIGEPRTICRDSTGILLGYVSGGNPPYNYSWSTGSTLSTITITPIATRTYSLSVVDSKGCTGKGQITLEYGPPLSLAIQGLTTICQGDTTTLCAVATGGTGGNIYEWGPVSNTTSCIKAAPSSKTVYTVSVADYCGATATASATVYSTPTPVINFISSLSEGCAPLCIQFWSNVTIARGKIQQYIWQFGNGDTLKGSGAIYCYQRSGKYSITLTAISDSGGCSASLTKVDMITMHSRPRAAFTFSPQPASILTPTIQFLDESSDNNGGIAYWWWTFGDNSDSSSNFRNPVHTYNDTGTFCANLIVMDNDGCTDTTTDCVIIAPVYSLYIPSAFTPNGDGLNETFKPVGRYVKDFDMYIFNRWGTEIYHTNNINNGWNGAVHGVGAICQEDVYIYKITVTDAKDKQHSYIGNVNLLK